MVEFNETEINNIVLNALKEDIGHGDVTTEAIVDENLSGIGTITSCTDGIVSGIDFAAESFKLLNESVQVKKNVEDGEKIKSGQKLMKIKGKMRTILSGERVALNFLQRMSGIATLTNKFVVQTEGRVKILDTRKTTPNLRKLEKYSVYKGGGVNHRFGLYDMFLIKDNHIAASGGDLLLVVEKVKERQSDLKIEVEVDSLSMIQPLLNSGVDRIMLDNMSNEEIKEAVKIIDGHIEIEVSGGITLDRIKSLSKLGIDFISVGLLTHSYSSLDMTLDIERKGD